jgi:UPF0755 protein
VAPKFVKRLIALALTAGLLGGAWFALQDFPLGGSGRAVTVTVVAGDSMSTIAAKLQQAGVIASAVAFGIDDLIFGSPVVVPGSYEFTQGSSFGTIRGILAGGPNAVVLNVTPGMTLHEIEVVLNEDEGLVYAQQFAALATAAAAQSDYGHLGSLEGLVGPGSFIIAPHETAAVLLSHLQTSFAQETQSVGFTPSTRLQGLTSYQLLIAASIVEKEGYYPVNMPKVARVIFNRLATGSALQMDSTVLYALHQDGGVVTPAMLAIHTPYNTYLNAGLTPTPICVVSTDALRAVLHAPVGTWRYFVLVNRDGAMAFATTFAQQLRNEELARQRGLA